MTGPRNVAARGNLPISPPLDVPGFCWRMFVGSGDIK